MGKNLLKITCENMIKDLGSILTQIEDHKKKDSTLNVYNRKKGLLKRIVFPDKAMDSQELDIIKHKLVRVVFFFLYM